MYLIRLLDARLLLGLLLLAGARQLGFVAGLLGFGVQAWVPGLAGLLLLGLGVRLLGLTWELEALDHLLGVCGGGVFTTSPGSRLGPRASFDGARETCFGARCFVIGESTCPGRQGCCGP